MSDISINLDFEDSKPETFVFQLPEKYAGKPVYGTVTADADARYTFKGTRDEVAPVGRILTRFYGAKVIQAGAQKLPEPDAEPEGKSETKVK